MPSHVDFFPDPGAGQTPLPTSLGLAPAAGPGTGPGGPGEPLTVFDMILMGLADLANPIFGDLYRTWLNAENVAEQQQAVADFRALMAEGGLSALNDLQVAYTNFEQGQGRERVAEAMTLAETRGLQARGEASTNRLGGFVGQTQQQEKKDINRRFDELSGTTRANLAARGLSGSSAMPTLLAGIERERGNSLGGLADRQITQDINLTSAIANFDLMFAQPTINQLGIQSQTLGRQNAARFDNSAFVSQELGDFFTGQQAVGPTNASGNQQAFDLGLGSFNGGR